MMRGDKYWRTFIGSRVESYILKELIGYGGFAGVFRATYQVSGREGRDVTVKLIFRNAQYSTYQLPEVLYGPALVHPHIIRHLSGGEVCLNATELFYLVLELANGGSLKQKLERSPLGAEEVLDLIAQTASALDYIHRARFVHRDVKPSNILFDQFWKLADCGTMREIGAGEKNRTMLQFGTPHYMPPESFEHFVLPAWDVWSLGAVAVEALTGIPLYQASSTTSIKSRIATGDPPIPDHLPYCLDEVVRGCLDKDPAERWTAQRVVGTIETHRNRAATKSTATVAKDTSAPIWPDKTYTEQIQRDLSEAFLSGRWAKALRILGRWERICGIR